MRITTRMLNEKARQTGLPINSSSLLSHLNNTASNDHLVKALNKGRDVAAAGTSRKSNYDKLEKSAEQLQKRADSLAAKGENSVYEKARESKSTEELCKEAQALVQEYNNALKILQTTPGALNDYYGQMLRETAGGNSEALASIGINLSKDGKMTVDSEKLKAADVDTLEKVLGSSGDFTSRISFLAGSVCDNARAGAESLTSQYGANGNLLAAVGGKYSFWG